MMTPIVAIILTALASQAVAQKYVCPIYRCSEKNLGDGQCINHFQKDNIDYNEISLNCKEGTVCHYDPIPQTNVTCTAVVLNNVDGEVCKEDKNCASGKCDAGKCKGKADKEKCLKDEECAVGFYCAKVPEKPDEKICSPQLEEKAKCTTELDCKNGLGCNMDGVCAPFFTLKDGDKTNDERFCQSMKVVESICASTTRIDEKAECVADEKTQQTSCKYKVVGPPEELTKEYKEPCDCSRAYSDRKFCPLGSTEKQYVDAVKALKDFYNGDALKLHTIRRDKMSYSLKKKILPALDYPKYENVDKCALDIDAANPYIKISLGFIVGMLLLLF